MSGDEHEQGPLHLEVGRGHLPAVEAIPELGLPEGEEALAEAEEEVGFDLGIDVAQPLVQPDGESFDIAVDLAYGNDPHES
ncbi:hypothetical protein [Kribbella sp. VKM Ac-2568]|uniref:hypothetical protein n=1 Tax=Kribbella sp. VKM Ac-2568 TaxID=2512219 RepID=UPI0010527F3D|nr:hypothetical protein [Kribbella sp. VKM Ac-2568]TCM46836.1 hypothetical protein EV648_105314 [Kribbella sp. VKM Ac-2568]